MASEEHEMKAVMLIAVMALPILAGEIVDLGVISTRRAIVMEKRPDFGFFILHILPQNWPTNLIAIVKTNEFLTLNDLDRAPSGDVVIEVKQICKDGSECPTSSFKIDLRRYDPEAVIYLTKDQQWEVVRAMQEAERNAPPIPGATRPPPNPSALPGGTNESYAEGRMRKFYAEPRKE